MDPAIKTAANVGMQAPVSLIWQEKQLQEAESGRFYAARLIKFIAAAYMLLSFFIKALPVTFTLVFGIPVVTLFTAEALFADEPPSGHSVWGFSQCSSCSCSTCCT